MFGTLTRRLHAWHLRNITRRKLSVLDDRLLSDMGIRRDDSGDMVAWTREEGDRK